MIFKRGIEVKESLKVGAEANAIEVSQIYFEGMAILKDKISGEIVHEEFVCSTMNPEAIFERIQSGENHRIPFIVRLKKEFWKKASYMKNPLRSLEIKEVEMTLVCKEGPNFVGGVAMPENHVGDFFKVGEKYYELPKLK